jgi:hypothetical protein
MTLKHLAYGALIGVTTLVIAVGSATTSEAKAKKKAAAAPASKSLFCIQPYAPVCGTRGGMKFTYANACYAAKDGATAVTPGACKQKAMKGKTGGKKKAMKKKK